MSIRVTVEFLDKNSPEGKVETSHQVTITDDVIKNWAPYSVLRVADLVADWARHLFIKGNVQFDDSMKEIRR